MFNVIIFPDSCSDMINVAHNDSLLPSQSGWSYAQCPDVNECDLKLDNCHPEAVCTNTDGSFTCECRRGFFGDGHHSCTKTWVVPSVVQGGSRWTDTAHSVFGHQHRTEEPRGHEKLFSEIVLKSSGKPELLFFKPRCGKVSNASVKDRNY